MHYLIISFTHKNSTMEIREKLSYPDDESLRACLAKLLEAESISEAVLISTCNRMEVFCSCADTVSATLHIFEMLSRRSGINIDALEGRADIFEDSAAIGHLFSVAASLDSMVLGETQIVGQLKDAFRFSYDNHFCAKKIARAMKGAFKAAAKVRNATEISSKPVSMASVAVSKLKSLLSDLEGRKALVIGVGEMSQITAKHLVAAGADVYIMNRTLHKAQALAKECGAKVIEFAQLTDAINEFEILFSATSAYGPIIKSDFIEPRDFDRYWFDLALPRDISYDKGERIHLYIIDDLKLIVDENISARENAARSAQMIIAHAVEEFFASLDLHNTELLIKEIYTKAYKAAETETQRAIKAGYIPKEFKAEAQKMCEQTLKRFLHEITANMRSGSEERHAQLLKGALHSTMKTEDIK